VSSGFLPRRWSAEELEQDRQEALARFRTERMAEPLDLYIDQYQQAEINVERYMEETIDLSLIEKQATALFAQEEFLEFLRYLSGPPISEDDLQALLGEVRFNRTVMRKNPEARVALMSIIFTGLDRERFPWVSSGREPLESERRAAVVATCALIATQHTQTLRRSEGGNQLEAALKQVLREAELTEVEPPRRRRNTSLVNAVAGPADFPEPGMFYGKETLLADRKADAIARTRSSLLVPFECKSSNSETNSIKRLNNDAAAKAAVWVQQYGTRTVVPIAVLSGVYKLSALMDAQSTGLYLIWGHRLGDLTEWLNSSQ